MNIIQGYFGLEKKRVGHLEAGELVTILASNWEAKNITDCFFYKPEFRYLFPDKLSGEDFESFKKFVTSSRWEVALVAGENIEVKYLGPRIGELGDEKWTGQSFFVKAKYLKKV